MKLEIALAIGIIIFNPPFLMLEVILVQVCIAKMIAKICCCKLGEYIIFASCLIWLILSSISFILLQLLVGFTGSIFWLLGAIQIISMFGALTLCWSFSCLIIGPYGLFRIFQFFWTFRNTCEVKPRLECDKSSSDSEFEFDMDFLNDNFPNIKEVN